MVDALKSLAGITGNHVYQEAIQMIQQGVSIGQSLQFAIQQTQLFPNRVVQMVTIGEESGKLEPMLSKLADFYEQEVDHQVEVLSSLFESLIMFILGLLVGGLVVAMYLPLFQLGMVL